MKVTVIGTGRVGLVTGACLADLGNEVLCLDAHAANVALLNGGGMPIHEPGLKELVQRNRAEGRLTFSTDAAQAVAHGDIQMIAVGTPPDENGAADLAQVLAAARVVGRLMTGFKVIVNKSTVPVGAGDQVSTAISAELEKRGEKSANFAVVSNPEFLKEGSAVEDFMRPDRIIIGVGDDGLGQKARTIMQALYAPFNRNHHRTLYMDVRSAEFTKYAANAMLATRISFMNELANLAEDVGADIEWVRQGMGSDPRIGYSFLYAGAGYGGSCFPKDVKALSSTAAANGRELRILAAVEAVNADQKQVLAGKIRARFGDDLTGRRFAVWGLAFKPDTDDMRSAPSRALITDLAVHGATLCVYDPVAMPQARLALAQDLAADAPSLARVEYAASPMEALDGADALAILTEWKAFKSPDFLSMKERLKHPVIFDGRNLYDPAGLARLGFEYAGIGRGNSGRPDRLDVVR